MLDWIPSLVLLAQDKAPAGDRPPPPSGFTLLVPFLFLGFLWYLMLVRPQRREQRRRDAMVKALKKNDRVITIGGIFGTVANVAPNDTEVTLKVDDNTRIRVLRSSIQTVLTDENDDSSKAESSKK